MASQIYPFSTYAVVPWKNGGGSTREIAKELDPDGRIIWRLSLATIAASGGFSLFPGLRRIIVALSGDQVILSGLPNGSKSLEINEPLTFDGDIKVYADLCANGCAEDFNVIFDPKVVRAELKVLHLDAGAAIPEFTGQSTLGVLFVSCGEIKTEGERLKRYDTLVTSERFIAGHAVQASVVFAIAIEYLR